jgi:hypothetical protein
MRTSLTHAGLALALASLLASATARAADADRDGLDDATEDALLERFAPVVLLHPSEAARPGGADWLLSRSDLEAAPGRQRVLAAALLGSFAWRRPPDPEARLRPRAAARAGSADPRDWETYGHAFRADDGGVLLQYWFFYPFNDAYGFFDHEGDWEHVTVKLDDAHHPQGAFYARHADSPGPFSPWTALRLEGDHPVVLAARGTHASYPSRGDAPFWERVCPAEDPAQAADAGCAVWRTWAPETGGVVALGERAAPRVGFLSWAGRWGSTGRFGVDSRAEPPPGPAFQLGWCAGAAPGACP